MEKKSIELPLILLVADPVQHRIAVMIRNHLNLEFQMVDSFLSKGNEKTSDYMLDKIGVFLIQSELAYQSEFSVLDSYLESVRLLLNAYYQHPAYWSNRLAAFRSFIDAFNALNESAFSEVEHIDYSEVKTSSDKPELALESEHKPALSDQANTKAEEIFLGENMDYNEAFEYAKSIACSISSFFSNNNTFIRFHDRSALEFDHIAREIQLLIPSTQNEAA